jgi:hypothetical protein
MNDDRPNYSNPYVAWGPMWPFIAPWAEAMRAWTRAMSALVPGAVPDDAWNPYSTGAARSAGWSSTAAAMSPKVSVIVSSQHCTTEVSACVDPGADTMCLTTDPFLETGDEQQAPSRRRVVVACEPGHVRVRVTVPDNLPEGRYTGAIRDADGCRRGELTVQISKPAPAA